MTCSDGTGSLKFIQLPLPEVLLSGTQQLTVERVIEQSFDTINVSSANFFSYHDQHQRTAHRNWPTVSLTQDLIYFNTEICIRRG